MKRVLYTHLKPTPPKSKIFIFFFQKIINSRCIKIKKNHRNKSFQKIFDIIFQKIFILQRTKMKIQKNFGQKITFKNDQKYFPQQIFFFNDQFTLHKKVN